MKRVTLALALLACVTLSAQGVVSIDDLLKPTSSSWPMYNGDYSGRRFSSLSTIDASTVTSMTLAWVYRPNPGLGAAGGRRSDSRSRSRARRSS